MKMVNACAKMTITCSEIKNVWHVLKLLSIVILVNSRTHVQTVWILSSRKTLNVFVKMANMMTMSNVLTVLLDVHSALILIIVLIVLLVITTT